MRRISVLFALLAVCTLNVYAQSPNFWFPGMPKFTMTAKAHVEPEKPMVGEPCAIILELDVDGKAAFNQVRVVGLPEGKDDSIAYGSLENLADGKSATAGHVVKRIRLPVRFLKPVLWEASLTVEGMVGTVQGGSSFFRNFGKQLDPLQIDARPLPDHGRPANFSGAVGRRFEMKQTLDRDHVQPNDLIVATYTLNFDGYYPSNVYPNVACLSKEFKGYKLKEVERTDRRVVWTQVLMPRTAQATNTAYVSINYYNLHTKRYEVACAEPLKLAFGSGEPSATKPSLEIVASSTNLVVAEPVQVSLVLKLPPVPGDYADTLPPIYNQRPPHFTCPFLDAEWKGGAFDRGDSRVPLAPEQMSRRGVRGPAFTLNNYMKDSFPAMMDDPFDLFDGTDPFGHLGPKRQLFPFTVVREADKGWCLTIALAPWRATAPGTVRLDPVTVEVPLVTGVRCVRNQLNRAVVEPVISNVVLRTKPITLTVAELPVAGRPASWCGAVASNINVTAAFDAMVYTAGDPMTLTLEIAGAANPSSVYPPDFTSVLTGSIFRVDTNSLKMETLNDTRRFSWRVRSVNTGTVDFPPLPVSYYDVGRHAYVTRMTESFPIQVKPGR